MKNMLTENISEPCRKNRLQMTLKILESWAKFTKFDQSGIIQPLRNIILSHFLTLTPPFVMPFHFHSIV